MPPKSTPKSVDEGSRATKKIEKTEGFARAPAVNTPLTAGDRANPYVFVALSKETQNQSMRGREQENEKRSPATPKEVNYQ